MIHRAKLALRAALLAVIVLSLTAAEGRAQMMISPRFDNGWWSSGSSFGPGFGYGRVSNFYGQTYGYGPYYAQPGFGYPGYYGTPVYSGYSSYYAAPGIRFGTTYGRPGFGYGYWRGGRSPWFGSGTSIISGGWRPGRSTSGFDNVVGGTHIPGYGVVSGLR